MNDFDSIQTLDLMQYLVKAQISAAEIVYFGDDIEAKKGYLPKLGEVVLESEAVSDREVALELAQTYKEEIRIAYETIQEQIAGEDEASVESDESDEEAKKKAGSKERLLHLLKQEKAEEDSRESEREIEAEPMHSNELKTDAEKVGDVLKSNIEHMNEEAYPGLYKLTYLRYVRKRPNSLVRFFQTLFRRPRRYKYYWEEVEQLVTLTRLEAVLLKELLSDSTAIVESGDPVTGLITAFLADPATNLISNVSLSLEQEVFLTTNIYSERRVYG